MYGFLGEGGKKFDEWGVGVGGWQSGSGQSCSWEWAVG